MAQLWGQYGGGGVDRGRMQGSYGGLTGAGVGPVASLPWSGAYPNDLAGGPWSYNPGETAIGNRNPDGSISGAIGAGGGVVDQMTGQEEGFGEDPYGGMGNVQGGGAGTGEGGIGGGGPMPSNGTWGPNGEWIPNGGGGGSRPGGIDGTYPYNPSRPGGGGGGRPGFPGGGVPAQRPMGNALGGALQGLANQYGQSYQQALARNQQLYNSVLSGYQQRGNTLVGQQNSIAEGYQSAANNTLGMLKPMQTALQQQQQGNANIQQGYGQLSKDVLSGIQGIDAAQRQQINNTYAQQSGATTQSAISRGLGNSTVLDSMQRGNQTNRDFANLALTNQTQGINAGYQSQLGLAGLGFAGQAQQQNTNQQNLIASNAAGYNTQYGLAGLNYLNQAAQQQTGLVENALGFQGSATAPYPQAGQYAQLAGQLGNLYGAYGNR